MALLSPKERAELLLHIDKKFFPLYQGGDHVFLQHETGKPELQCTVIRFNGVTSDNVPEYEVRNATVKNPPNFKARHDKLRFSVVRPRKSA